MSAKTSSPGSNRVTPRPTASTRPAMSEPRMCRRGRRRPPRRAYSGSPRSDSQSDRLRETACTRTSTSPSAGTGVGTCGDPELVGRPVPGVDHRLHGPVCITWAPPGARSTACYARPVPDPADRPAKLPPRWVIRIVWSAHRFVTRVTRGRVGLWRPRPGGWGALRLTTTGRRTGQERTVIVGYFEDGPNLVTLAMNGWAEGEPAWWLNLQAHPDARVDLGAGARPVQARAARRAGTGAPVGTVAHDRHQHRRVCGVALRRDGGRGSGASSVADRPASVKDP